MSSDSELLTRYRESRCEAAFTELVRRYIDFVYSAARRQIGGDAHLANDVTQRVFIEFGEKARLLNPGTVLTGWLYTATRFAAAKAVRAEHRWRVREEKAMEMFSEDSSREPQWEDLRPVLDSAMHELNERDRDAVLLRYFEGKPLAEVGSKLGLSEDAARMRVARALEKLRQLLARHGVSSSTAALAGLLTQQTVSAAPAGLAATVAGSALAGAAPATNTAALLTIMTTKSKIALLSVAVAAIATPLALQHQSATRLRHEVEGLRTQNEQLAVVHAENRRLSNLLAEASRGVAPTAETSSELLKLRGEVARLREDSRELARLKTAAASAGTDPSIQATLQRLATRATQLKYHLEKYPHTKIPELQFITDKEWIDAVAKSDLDSDAHVRQALNSLRSSAKATFGKMMQKALKQYTEVNGGMLPSDIQQLQPYFNPPIDPSLLQRYEVVQEGNVADIPPNKPLIAEIAPPVDEEYDTRFDFRISGTSSRSVSRSGELLQAAALAYADANHGLLPRAPGDLLPYLQGAVDPQRIQKFLADIPPSVKTVDQIKSR